MILTLQIIGVLVGYLISLADKKTNILILSVISGISSIVMYFVLGRYDGLITAIVVLVRNFLFTFKDKYKTDIIFYICFLMHFITGVVSFTDLLSIVTLVTPLVTSIAYWYFDESYIKYTSIVVNILWILYYMFTKLYLMGLNTSLNIILLVVSLIKISNKRLKNEE